MSEYRIPRVFVSSTFEDLKAHREAASAALRGLDMLPIMMDDFSLEYQNSLDFRLRQITECDTFIGIYAHRYGACPAGEVRSFTELEYQHAEALGKKLLILLVDEQYNFTPQDAVLHYADYDPRLQKLKIMLRKRHNVLLYATPEDVEGVITLELLPVDTVAAAPAAKDNPAPPSGCVIALPYLSAEEVFNREDERGLLRAQMLSGKSVILSGRAGAGKTSLARSLVHDAIIQHYFGTILWVNVGQRGGTASADVQGWSSVFDLDAEGLTQDQLLQRVTHKLKHHPSPALMILDEVWDEAAAKQYFLEVPQLTHVMIAQDRKVISALSYNAQVFIHEVKPLETAAGVNYLTWRMAQIARAPEYREMLKQMVEFYGGLPAALELLKAHLKEALEVSERNLFSELKRIERDIRLYAGNLMDAERLMELIKQRFEMLDLEQQDCLLGLLAFPAEPATFSLELGLNVLERVVDWSTDSTFAHHLQRLCQTLLVKRFVAEDGAERYALNTFTVKFLQQRASAQQRERAHEAFVLALLDYAEDNSDLYARLDLEHVSLFEAVRYAAGHDMAASFVHLLRVVAPYWEARGFYTQAQRYLVLALDNPDGQAAGTLHAELCFSLARVRLALGDPQDSEIYAKQALTALRHVDSANPNLEIALLTHLGRVMMLQSKSAQAEARWDQALEIAMRLNHYEWISVLLNNLGSLVMRTNGDPQEALTYYQHGLEAARKSAKEDRILQVVSNLAAWYVRERQLDQAEAAVQEGLVLAQLVNTLDLHGKILQTAGHLEILREDFVQAQQYFMRLIALAGSAGHAPLLSYAHAGLAETHLKQRRFAEAERHLQQSLTFARETNDSNQYAVLLTLLTNNLEQRLADAQAEVDYENLLYQDLIDFAKAEASLHDSLAHFLFLRARAETAKQNYAAAEKSVDESLLYVDNPEVRKWRDDSLPTKPIFVTEDTLRQLETMAELSGKNSLEQFLIDLLNERKHAAETAAE